MLVTMIVSRDSMENRRCISSIKRRFSTLKKEWKRDTPTACQTGISTHSNLDPTSSSICLNPTQKMACSRWESETCWSEMSDHVGAVAWSIWIGKKIARSKKAVRTQLWPPIEVYPVKVSPLVCITRWRYSTSQRMRAYYRVSRATLRCQKVCILTRWYKTRRTSVSMWRLPRDKIWW